MNTAMNVTEKISLLKETSPAFCKRRRKQFIMLFIRRFLEGMQFSIVIPSLWAYVKSFGEHTWFFGFTLCMYSVSGIIALPVAGMLFDYYKTTKEIIITMNFFEIAGSLIYSLGFSKWLLPVGRFLSGVGGGYRGVLSSELTWITTKEERLGVFSAMELGTLLGLFFGPALSAVFKWVDFRVGSWHVTFTSAPGVFCCITWTCFQLASILAIRNLAKEVSMGTYDHGSSLKEIELDTYSLLQDEELKENNVGAKEASYVQKEKPETFSYKALFDEIATLEVGFIYFAAFLIRLLVTMQDTMIPLFTQEDFKWTPAFTSLAYLAIGVEGFLIYAMLVVYGKGLEDEVLLVTGLAIILVESFLWQLYNLQRQHYSIAVGIFFTAHFFGVFSYAVFEVGVGSVLSKIISPEFQGMVQGSIVILFKYSNIIGPNIGGLAFHHMLVTFSIYGGLVVVSIIWGFFSISAIKQRKALIAS